MEPCAETSKEAASAGVGGIEAHAGSATIAHRARREAGALASPRTGRPVTVLAAKGNYVTAHRTQERDGYTALQLGFDEQKASRKNKPELGHLKKSEATPKRILREFRVDAGKLL